MNVSMYQTTLPGYIRALKNLDAILDKAATFCEEKNIKPDVLVNYRLAPDMHPLTTQIQIASDTAKGCAARLSGVEPPKYEDNETTLPELKARIAKTIDFLKSVSPEAIDGTEDKDIQLKFPNATLDFKGLDYVVHFVTPNFYFHVTTAYAILRHAGVPLSKYDYLGGR